MVSDCGGSGLLPIRSVRSLVLRPEARVLPGDQLLVQVHTVNDPLLKAFNDYLLSGKEVIWADFWRHAGAILAGNPRFADYIAPGKNAGIVFLKAYRALTGDHQPTPPPPERHVSLRAMQPPCVAQQG
jgi:hypothetical protein